MKYFKIYHYSPKIISFFPPYNSTLDTIDPAYYGTGVTKGSECKHGKNGLNKSYFYTKDEPESCVRSGNVTRYEIYLPFEWKEQIYDAGLDESLYLEAKKQLKESNPYHNIDISENEICELREKLIKENGCKGWTNSKSLLPHVIVLFEKLPTRKPSGEYIALDWSNNVIENTFANYQKPYNNFFKPALQISTEIPVVRLDETRIEPINQPVNHTKTEEMIKLGIS